MLWEFSLSLYAKPKIAELCLQLQDIYGVNVTLLLWSVWLEQQQLSLTDERLKAGVALIQQWHTNYVEPLRDLRRRMKGEFINQLESIAPVRAHIKQAELLAEQYELQCLQTFISSWHREENSVAPGKNARFYLSHEQVPQTLIMQFIVLCEQNIQPIN